MIGIAIGIILAVIRVTARHSKNPAIRILNAFAKIYVTVIRGTPMIVQLFVVYYGLPNVGIKLDAFR